MTVKDCNGITVVDEAKREQSLSTVKKRTLVTEPTDKILFETFHDESLR